MSALNESKSTSEAFREETIQGHGRQRRVLHVIEATLGGTLVYLNTAIAASEGLPFEFALAYSTRRATPSLSDVLAKAERFGWQLFPLEMERSLGIRHDLRSMLDLVAIYRDFRPDIVHSHSSKAGALSRLAKLAGWRKPRVIYTPHAIAAPLGRRYMWIERALAPLTARLVPVSDSEANELLKMRLTSPGRYRKVDPMVDTCYFMPRDKVEARADLGLSQTAPLIVGLGRLTAQKDPMAFLQALQCLSAEIPAAQGIWVGDGEMRSAFLEHARKLGIEKNLTLVGWKRDVRPWLAAADVLLSTSLYESFGYMVAESLAMERPVVATNITGTCDIMNGDFASWLYERGSAGQAARLLALLLSNPIQAAEIGTAGRAMIVQRFSSQVMRKALFSLYTELC